MASGVVTKNMARFDGSKLRLPDGSEFYAVNTKWEKGDLILSPNPDFVAWMNEHNSWAYDGGIDTRYTARKEMRRGGAFWYAFAFIGGKTVKRYIGASDEIDSIKLMSVGLEFAKLRADLRVNA